MKRFFFCLLLFMAALSPALEARAESISAIAPQSLISALDEFVARTGLQLVYRSEVAASVKSKGADGGLSPQLTLRGARRHY